MRPRSRIQTDIIAFLPFEIKTFFASEKADKWPKIEDNPSITCQIPVTLEITFFISNRQMPFSAYPEFPASLFHQGHLLCWLRERSLTPSDPVTNRLWPWPAKTLPRKSMAFMAWTAKKRVLPNGAAIDTRWSGGER